MSSTVIMPTSRPRIDHRGRDQRIFLEAQRDFLLVHRRPGSASARASSRRRARRRAACAGSTESWQVPTGRCAGSTTNISQNSVVQFLVAAQIVDQRRRPSYARAPRSARAASAGRRFPPDRPARSSIAARSSGSSAREDCAAGPPCRGPRSARPRRRSRAGRRARRPLGRLERLDHPFAHAVVHLGDHFAVDQVGDRLGERARAFRAGSARTDRRCRRDGAARPVSEALPVSPASSASEHPRGRNRPSAGPLHRAWTCALVRRTVRRRGAARRASSRGRGALLPAVRPNGQLDGVTKRLCAPISARHPTGDLPWPTDKPSP